MSALVRICEEIGPSFKAFARHILKVEKHCFLRGIRVNQLIRCREDQRR